jgi:hypothetical protein
MHTEASEKSQVVSLHERYVEWVGGHEGVGWVVIERIVDGLKREAGMGECLTGCMEEGGVAVGSLECLAA